MKVKTFLSSCLIFATTCLFAQIDLSKVTINVKTNKPSLSYKKGEKMVYTFTADFANQKSDGYFLSYTRRGDDNQTIKGKSPANKPLVIETSLNKPGFVSVNVYLTDAKGTYLKAKINNKRFRYIANFAGTAVEPETLTECQEPADFDAFWARQRAKLAKVEFRGKVDIKKVKTIRNVNIYAVSIPCAGPRPATGYLTIPVNAKPGSLPALISFFGYGNAFQGIPGRVNTNCIHLSLNAHGQKLGMDKQYYVDFFNSIKSNGKNYAFDPIQNSDPEKAFFNGMALRVMRALEYLKTRPEWNKKDLQAMGGSQGGLQTLWAAALDKDVTLANAAIPWCCDLAGTTKKQRISGSWRIKYVPGLDYYDPVFLVKRIKTATVNITRAGMGDYVCPPSGVAICYKNIASPRKSIAWYQGSDHGFVPKNHEITIWKTYDMKKK